MKKPKSKKAAFPFSIDGYQPQTGMSLRDYFAGQALIGILGARTGFLVDVGVETCGTWAYRAADAMIAARDVREVNEG